MLCDLQYSDTDFVFLGFTWRHKLFWNQCPPCWCPSRVKFMLIIAHFYSEASLLSLYYFANYVNIPKEKKNDKSTGHSTKDILVLSEYAKSSESWVKERYSQKISVIGVDPESILAEHFSPEYLCPVEVSDLLSYLVLETSFYTKGNKQFKAFKSLEAFNQMGRNLL